MYSYSRRTAARAPSASPGSDAARLASRSFVEADDVLARRCVVVDVQHVVALEAKRVVVRRQIHLLSMRLQVGVAQDASDRAVADRNVLATNVRTKQRSRPVRDRDAYVLGRSARLGFDAGRIGVREREIGRPERGASASFATGSSVLEEALAPLLHSALVHAQSARSVTLAHACRHQEKRLSSQHDALLGLRGADRRFHRFALFRRERQRLRSRAGVRSQDPRLGMIMQSATGSHNIRPNFAEASCMARTAVSTSAKAVTRTTMSSGIASRARSRSWIPSRPGI